MNIAVQSNVTPGAERLAIVLTAESDAESYDLGRVTGILEIMQAPGGKFKDDGKAELTLVLFDRSKTASKQPAPASDKDTEELAQVCIASAQEQERTCTGAPGTLSAEACRMIADVLRSMESAKRHKIEWWNEKQFETRALPRSRQYGVHSETISFSACYGETAEEAIGKFVMDNQSNLNLTIEERKETT